MSHVDVVLASSSPRRRELLTLVGIPHVVMPADIDETPQPDEAPAALVTRLAREKATRVAERLPDAARALVVAADTVVVLDGEILGKPVSVDEAERTIGRLSGRTHTVATGIACALNGRLVSDVEQVAVTFRRLDADEIRAYVATGEPMDKAGSYGIQGFGATIVQRIDGDYFAVMGLSLVRMLELMRELGVHYHFGQSPLTT
jgi:septum formation protein